MYIKNVDDYLEHFGVKGMRWGTRNASGVSRSTNRDARKDAKEFAAAKMFYGEGAGNRRKLIKAKVETKSKRDPNYAKAFKDNLNNQDLAKASDKARKERKSTDRKVKNKQRAGFVARKLTGEMGTQAAFTAAVIGGAAFLNSPKGRQTATTAMSKISGVAKTVSSSRAQKVGADTLTAYFKRTGMM